MSKVCWQSFLFICFPLRNIDIFKLTMILHPSSEKLPLSILLKYINRRSTCTVPVHSIIFHVQSHVFNFSLDILVKLNLLISSHSCTSLNLLIFNPPPPHHTRPPPPLCLKNPPHLPALPIPRPPHLLRQFYTKTCGSLSRNGSNDGQGQTGGFPPSRPVSEIWSLKGLCANLHLEEILS